MAVGGQVFEFLTEENQLHKGSGIGVHGALDSPRRGGPRLPRTERSASTEASAVLGSPGRSGGSGPEWRSLHSLG